MVAIAVGVVLSGALVGLVVLNLANPCRCPSDFGVVGWNQVAPGSIGCENHSGEVCYYMVVVTDFNGLRLSDLHFDVLGPPLNSSNVESGAPVPLGPGAEVTALNSSNATVGTLNWSIQSWTEGGGWTVPFNANTAYVLDSDLQNVSFSGDFWFFSFSSPGEGGGGVPL